ncbi:(2Fe-2S)-binding protein [Peribacillus frigoritolerans]|nr:(2Fe-2S)-binding protein [Peribacillus frigoritolerans]
MTELLNYIQSNLSTQDEKQTAFCSCTTLTEDEVVYKMQLQDVTTVQEAMDVLEWENTEGCSTCRPALSYYLGMIHPEYEIRQQTLFINEKRMQQFKVITGTLSSRKCTAG